MSSVAVVVGVVDLIIGRRLTVFIRGNFREVGLEEEEEEEEEETIVTLLKDGMFKHNKMK